MITVALLVNEAIGLLAAVGLLASRRPGSRDEWVAANYRVQRAWVRRLLEALRRVYGLRFEIDARLPESGPVILLPRHTGAADTLLPFVLFESPRELNPRYVLKHELLWGPCLNLVGRRLPNTFVVRGSDDRDAQVALVGALAEGLGPDDVVVLFPEGTRYSARKRAALLGRLEQRGELARLAEARSLEHVLPLREAGVSALLDAAPDATVVFMAHTGLEGISWSPELLARHLRDTAVRVSLIAVPAREAPTDPDERSAWLGARWREVDREVERLGQRDRGGEPDARALRQTR